MGTPADSPLGKATVYGDRYDPSLLFAVERAPQREAIGLDATVTLPFEGVDAWTVWEAGWLAADGRPRVAVVRFEVPAGSAAIVESKSVKLYFTALNDTRFTTPGMFRDTVARDLSRATGAAVEVGLVDVDDAQALARRAVPGESIDAAPLEPLQASPAPAQLRLRHGGSIVDEVLVSRLFRSVCPVTGQPDYAQVSVAYRGRALERGALLGYLLAYRHHPGFHEHCVERILCDLEAVAQPQSLSVAARFTRRGGIDINPMRWRGRARPADAPTLQQ